MYPHSCDLAILLRPSSSYGEIGGTNNPFSCAGQSLVLVSSTVSLAEFQQIRLYYLGLCMEGRTTQVEYINEK